MKFVPHTVARSGDYSVYATALQTEGGESSPHIFWAATGFFRVSPR
jgi:hypothetical protein